MLELAGAGDAACVCVFVETFDDIHVRLQRPHQITQLQLICAVRQFNAATFALAAVNITKLCQVMHDFDQMVARYAVMLGNLPHAATSVGMSGEVHQAAQAVICKDGQLHKKPIILLLTLIA